MKTFVLRTRVLTYATYEIQAESAEQAEEIYESGTVDPVEENVAESEVLVLPVAVVEAIVRRWPDQSAEILTQIKHAYDHYYFERWGQYIGIEYDGYIHT